MTKPSSYPILRSQGNAEEHYSWGNPKIPLLSWSYTGGITLSKSHPHSPKDTRRPQVPVRDKWLHPASTSQWYRVSLTACGPAGILLLQQPCPGGFPTCPLLTISLSVKQLYSSECSCRRAADSSLEQKCVHFSHLQANKPVCCNECLDPKAQTFTS